MRMKVSVVFSQFQPTSPICNDFSSHVFNIFVILLNTDMNDVHEKESAEEDAVEKPTVTNVFCLKFFSRCSSLFFY